MKKLFWRAVRRRPFTSIVVLAIVLLSLLPLPEELPLGDVTMIDKWTHLVMYGGLSWVAWLEHRRVPLLWGRLVAALLLPVALGALLEVMQEYLTTYRSGEWLDLAADALGAVLGFLLAWPTAWLSDRSGLTARLSGR